jgi:hypothetical protein
VTRHCDEEDGANQNRKTADQDGPELLHGSRLTQRSEPFGGLLRKHQDTQNDQG